jgi:hypothetical protein
MFPKTSSTNRRSAWAIREVDLFSFERNWGVFMRGIRAPRQNLSEKNKERRLSSCRVIETAVWRPPLLGCRR